MGDGKRKVQSTYCSFLRGILFNFHETGLITQLVDSPPMALTRTANRSLAQSTFRMNNTLFDCWYEALNAKQDTSYEYTSHA